MPSASEQAEFRCPTCGETLESDPDFGDFHGQVAWHILNSHAHQDPGSEHCWCGWEAQWGTKEMDGPGRRVIYCKMNIADHLREIGGPQEIIKHVTLAALQRL